MQGLIDEKRLIQLRRSASRSPRQRAHYNFHKSPEDSVQRLLIALQPDTYVPVHRHTQEWKWEMLVLIQGKLDCLIFDDQGRLKNRQILEQETGVCGIEIPANYWHSFICQKQNSVILELKPGPYNKDNAAEFSSLAPTEDDPNAERFLRWMKLANIGEKFQL